MATEIELKLSLPAKAAGALACHPRLAGAASATQLLRNTYFDTAELDLWRRRLALRLRKRGWQQLLTVKSGEAATGGLATRNEWEAPAKPGVWDFSHVDDDGVRDRLEALAPRLSPAFTTDFRRRTWIVEEGGSRIEVALDRGHIVSGERHETLCEVELELLNGTVADLFALARELQASLPLRPSAASKAERGYRLFRGDDAQPFKARAPALTRDATPVAAFRRIALACLEQLQRNEAGAAIGDDPEYVHQARVALRRMRSALKLFAPVLPADFAPIWGGALGTLAAPLGEARNWDVFVGETLPPILSAFPDDRASLRLLATGRRNARHARTAVRSLLALPEYPRLVLDFTAAVIALDDPPDQATLSDFATASLGRRARQAARLARAHADLSDSERHQLRIRLKKLRYAVEFFAALLPARRLKPYLAALAQLQDELGLINDHVTALDLLAQLPTRDRSGPVLGWLHGRHALLLTELSEALDTWLAQAPPWKR